MVFLFILLVLLIIIFTMNLKIEIHNVNFTLKEPQNDSKVFNIKDNYKVKITLKIVGFIPIFTTSLTSEKVDKLSKKFKKFDLKTHLKSFKKDSSLLDTRKIIGNLNFKIKEFDLKARIGLDSIMILTFVIPFISTFISIFLAKKKVKIKNQFYQIKPLYNLRKYIKYYI